MLCHRVRPWSVFVLALCFVLVAALPAAAQPKRPVAPPGWPHVPAHGTAQDPVTGMGRMPARASERATVPSSVAAYAGPDQFGYVAAPGPVQWIDGSAGTPIPFTTGTALGQSTYMALPFPFKFYENTYTSVFVAAPGYLAFSPWDGWGVPPAIGSAQEPNNIVSAFPNYYALAGAGTAGRVYTVSGGTAPNRYFAVEWHQVVARHFDQVVPITNTFQIVLEEDGDMRIQLKETTSPPGYLCADTGIENEDGTDGLVLRTPCEPVQPEMAWQITRPDEGAHLYLHDTGLDGFAHPGKENFAAFLLRNTGDQPDRFNVTATSGVPVRFVGPNGATLADSDGDGKADTGLLDVGEAAVIQAGTHFPAFGNTGDTNAATVLVASTRDPSLQRVLSLSAVVPPAFAQSIDHLFFDAFNVAVVAPVGESVAHLDTEVPDTYLASHTLATRPEAGYVAAWVEHDQSGDALKYVLLDLAAQPLDSAQVLQPAAGEDESIFAPAAAVAPDGHIGVAWVGSEAKLEGGEQLYRYNVYLAVLAPDGSVASPPASLTGNTQFHPLNSANLRLYGLPALAATGDNRFAAAWEVYTYGPTEFDTIRNVEMALHSSAGVQVRAPFLLSESAASGKDRAHSPAIAALAGNRVAVAYGSTPDWGFAVLSGAGDVVRAFAPLDGAAGAYRMAVAEIGAGGLLFSWADWIGVHYALLDGETFTTRKPATPLSSGENANYPNVTRDGAGNGIITWVAFGADHLFVTAVNPVGDVVFPRTNFAGPTLGELLTGNLRPAVTGGSTPHALGATSPDKADPVLTVTGAHGAPGGPPAALAAHVLNRGALTAQFGSLTAQVDAPLAFAGASPKPASVIPGAGTTTVTWTLPDLDYLGGGTAVLLTSVPSATLGSSYAVTFTLTTPTPVLDPARGVDAAQVTVALPFYLPVMAR